MAKMSETPEGGSAPESTSSKLLTHIEIFASQLTVALSLSLTNQNKMKLLILFLFCHVASTVKHSLKLFSTATSGVPNFPEFVAAAMVDEVLMGYCDSNIKTLELKQDWVRKLAKDEPHHLEWYSQECFDSQQFFRANLDSLKQRLNQTGVKHSLKFFSTATSGVPNFPEFVAAAMVDEVLMGYCDINIKTPEPKQDWVRKLIKDEPQHLEWYSQECFDSQQFFRANLYSLKQRLNQTGDVHIFQRMNGCEWDNETGEVVGFSQYGYDGEDFLVLDLQTLTWTAPKQQAFITKLRWDNDKDRLEYDKHYYIQTCPDMLKKYLQYGRSSLQRTERPSVSLLQKTPSSPVSCHATDFYPDRAKMFWRKDGEEIHEDVDLGEILPNHDGSFQMSVELNLSSVAPEDWRRYDCVFHLSGVVDDIVTRLDKAVIRTNWVPPAGFPDGPVIGVVVGLLLLLLAVCIAGLFIWRRNNNGFRPANTGQ
ncbi:major histocompatibility complex class I-related gene protein-like isoform X17 [Sebastes umbrosus]|uniref:major histocompatibility complex class I-related gene protein-like isoform X17 n=1 Tax=Sebastes umbrosus TaxID=72105 RepID=UPI00189EBF0B|nr:major histocompatibility complex class I-related gene protein-like isoform X17 [Sebastes umbrosus]